MDHQSPELTGLDAKSVRMERECGCKLHRAGNTGKDIAFRFCPLHRAAPALLAALNKIRDIATAGLDEADRRNFMAAVGSLRVIQQDARAAIEAAKEETK